MADIDPIVVQISAEFGDLKRDLADVQKEVKGLGEDSKKSAKNTEKLAMSLEAVGVAATAAAAATGVFVASQLEAVKATELWSRRLGVASGKFAQLTAVGERFGAEMDDVGDAIKDLNERIADAAGGNKTYEEALKKIGLASKDLIKLPVEEQFLKVADAIGKLNNVGDQNFITAELMADAGFRLIPMFQQGEKAILSMMGSMERSNKVMSQDTITAYNELNEELKRLSEEGTALGNMMSGTLIPLLKDAAEGARFLAYDVRALLTTDKDDAIQKIGELDDAIMRVQKSIALAEGGSTTSFFGLFKGASADAENLKTKLAALNAEQQKFRNIASDTGVVQGPREATMEERQSGDPMLSAMGSEEGGTGDGMPSPAQMEEVMARRQILLAQSMAAEAQIKMEAQALEDEQAAARLELEEEWKADELNRMFEHNLLIAEEKERARLEEEEAQRRFMDREFGAHKRQIDRLKRLEKSGWQGRYKMGMEFTKNIAAALDDGSRKSFERTKKLNMAEAVINTIGGVTKALNNPYPVNLLFAASVAAAGAAQIAKISSSSYGGGGGGGAAAPVPSAVTEEQEPQNVIDANFVLQGEGGFSGDQIRSVASGLNDFIEDGGQIRSVNVI